MAWLRPARGFRSSRTTGKRRTSPTLQFRSLVLAWLGLVCRSGLVSFHMSTRSSSDLESSYSRIASA